MSNNDSDTSDGIFTGCFSPYADRLAYGFEIYSYIFVVLFPIATIAGLVWWVKRSWHPRLALRGNMFVFMIGFSAMFYGAPLHMVFLAGEGTSVNICALVTIAGGCSCLCFPPMYYLAYALKKKADYNKRLSSAINKNAFGGDSSSTGGELDALHSMRLQADKDLETMYKFMIFVTLAQIVLIIGITKHFCYRPDGECRFFVGVWSRPTIYWLIINILIQIGLLSARIGIDIVPHSWGLRHQVLMMPFYLTLLLVCHAWVVLDEYAGKFLATDETKEVWFTPFIGIDISACFVVGCNIHYQVYKSYDSFTKDRLNALKYEGMTLTEVLSDPVARKTFQDFLVTVQSSENILFYTTVETFLERKALDANYPRLKSAEIIYNRYISTDAPFQVNIASATRKNIQRKLKEAGTNMINFDTLFNEAVEEIRRLLGGFCFHEFKHTEEYTALAARNVRVDNFGPKGLL